MKSKILATKIDELLILLGESRTVSMLRYAEMPDHLAPTLTERAPFSCLSDEAIFQFLLYARDYPWGLGLLTQTLYRSLKVDRHCPIEFIVLESHIDVSNMIEEDEIAFVSMGFEPDHFETLNPPEYDRCYTLRWEIPRREWTSFNCRQAKQYVVEATKKICRKIEKRRYLAYAEIEIYSHFGKKKFENIDLEMGEIGHFPYKHNEFSEFTNSRQDSFKRADIHVKIPVGNESSESALTREKLKILSLMFIEAGFYEIRSKSGNRIFTIQCALPSDAVTAFHELVDWAEKSRLVRSINHETCLFFWRRQWTENGEYVVSPIPKVVKRNFRNMSI